MPISDTFISQFGSFSRNYKLNGLPTFFTWSKEQNHFQISDYLYEILDIASTNRSSLDDFIIIDHLNASILLSAKTNPYLLECWISFLTGYNAATKSYLPIGTLNIKQGQDGTPSERMIQALQKALKTVQEAQQADQSLHTTETTDLKRQIAELRLRNNQLTKENEALKTRVNGQTNLEKLHVQIETAQQQFDSVSQLLKSLHNVTKPKEAIQHSGIPLVDNQPVPTISSEPTLIPPPPKPPEDAIFNPTLETSKPGSNENLTVQMEPVKPPAIESPKSEIPTTEIKPPPETGFFKELKDAQKKREDRIREKKLQFEKEDEPSLDPQKKSLPV